VATRWEKYLRLAPEREPPYSFPCLRNDGRDSSFGYGDDQADLLPPKPAEQELIVSISQTMSDATTSSSSPSAISPTLAQREMQNAATRMLQMHKQ
jgi:hypothetical protein